MSERMSISNKDQARLTKVTNDRPSVARGSPLTHEANIDLLNLSRLLVLV